MQHHYLGLLKAVKTLKTRNRFNADTISSTLPLNHWLIVLPWVLLYILLLFGSEPPFLIQPLLLCYYHHVNDVWPDCSADLAPRDYFTRKVLIAYTTQRGLSSISSQNILSKLGGCDVNVSAKGRGGWAHCDAGVRWKGLARCQRCIRADCLSVAVRVQMVN